LFHLTSEQTAAIRDSFLPERPGPVIGMQVIQTGNGTCFADRWPDPRAVLVVSAGNYSLSGEADAVTPDELKPLIRGFVETSHTFVPILETAFPEVKVWDRVIFERPPAHRPISLADQKVGNTLQVRPIKPGDALDLQGLSLESAWITKTWGGAQGLASSGRAWGAFINGRLASVACTFFCAEKYEDIGVITEAEFRRLGLSTACAAALCGDIEARGGRPSWTTSPDNTASLRVAEKLGFEVQRNDRLYVIGIPIPIP
jgi:hypothetical protein